MVRVRSIALTMAAAVAVACSPDRTTAPDEPRPSVGGVAADIGNLVTDSPLFSQTSDANAVQRVDLPGITSLIADDFVVPPGQAWTLQSVIVAGYLIKPTLSLSIRADAGGHPGAVIGEWTLAPTAVDPLSCCDLLDYLFTLPPGVTLSAGSYWLAAETPAVGWQIGQGSGAFPMYSGGDGVWFPAGGAGYAFSLFGTVQSVPLTAQTIVFGPATPNVVTVGASATLSVAATSGLPVALSTSPGSVCTVSGTTVSFVGAGTCTITANQPGDAAYSAAPEVTRTVKVDYHFSGFADPVKNDAVNAAKAGRTIPLQWRITDASGAPITTLTAATISVKDLSCTAGSTANQIDESTAGASGLQNLGNGYYQLNWKTPASYARSCKLLQLDLGEGSGPRTASFAFTK